MNHAALSFDWSHARAFLVTAEAGTMSAAAETLGCAQSTLSRQVDALEQALGVVLFERVGRRLALTPGGRALAEPLREMAEAGGRFALKAAGWSQTLAGPIRVSASELYAAYVLPDAMAQLREAEPRIEVELVSDDAISDLQQREADIAVRSVRPDNPELIARWIRDVPMRLYAAESYLERLGPLRSPSDLARASFIGFDRSKRFLAALNALGLSLGPEDLPIVSASQLVQWQMLKRGLGVGLMPEELGEAQPGVRQALSSLPPIQVPMWLTAHRELHTSRRVRVVFDLLAEALSRPSVTV